MRNLNDDVFSAVTIDATKSSSVIDAQNLIAASLQGVVAGTVAGNLKLQYSNDFSNPTNWSDIPSATIAISNTGVYAIPKYDLCYRWIKAVYVTTSGTGTLSARINCIGY